MSSISALSCSPLLYHVLQNRLRQSIETEHPGRQPGEWVSLQQREEDEDEDEDEEADGR
jgi:hypothetical protein